MPPKTRQERFVSPYLSAIDYISCRVCHFNILTTTSINWPFFGAAQTARLLHGVAQRRLVFRRPVAAVQTVAGRAYSHDLANGFLVLRKGPRTRLDNPVRTPGHCARAPAFELVSNG
jgi:hypothetical protein